MIVTVSFRANHDSQKDLVNIPDPRAVAPRGQQISPGTFLHPLPSDFCPSCSPPRLWSLLQQGCTTTPRTSFSQSKNSTFARQRVRFPGILVTPPQGQSISAGRSVHQSRFSSLKSGKDVTRPWLLPRCRRTAGVDVDILFSRLKMPRRRLLFSEFFSVPGTFVLMMPQSKGTRGIVHMIIVVVEAVAWLLLCLAAFCTHGHC